MATPNVNRCTTNELQVAVLVEHQDVGREVDAPSAAGEPAAEVGVLGGEQLLVHPADGR